MYELIPVLIAVGVGAGALGSLLGVGGGIVIVPILTYLGLSPAQTSSTSLFSVLSTSSASTIEYSRQKRVDFGIGLKLAAAAAPGAILGAELTKLFTPETFKLYFGLLLILTGLYIINRRAILKERPKAPGASKELWMYAVAFGAGIISSLFGVGGGIIFVPLMLIVLGMPMSRAAPTSQLILLVTSAVGIATHAFLGNPDYAYAGVLMVGSFGGAQLGARISKRAKDKILEQALGVVLIGVACKMIFDWISKIK